MRFSDGVLETISALLRAAERDLDLRAQLRAVVSVPAFQRISLLNTAIAEMALRGEPEDVCAAFRLLGTDAGAQATLLFLSDLDGTG